MYSLHEGYQPFGPYSNTSALSPVTQAAARRAHMISRLDSLLRRLQEVLASYDAFIVKQLGLPFGERLAMDYLSKAVGGTVTWLDRAFSSIGYAMSE